MTRSDPGSGPWISRRVTDDRFQNGWGAASKHGDGSVLLLMTWDHRR